MKHLFIPGRRQRFLFCLVGLRFMCWCKYFIQSGVKWPHIKYDISLKRCIFYILLSTYFLYVVLHEYRYYYNSILNYGASSKYGFCTFRINDRVGLFYKTISAEWHPNIKHDSVPSWLITQHWTLYVWIVKL